MRIDRIQAFHVTVPLAEPYVLSKQYGTVRDAHAVIVELGTDDGLVGHGEANPMPPFTEETWGGVFAAIEHHLAPCLLGEDPAAIGRINRELDRVLAGNLLAKGALDVALWDLAGKALGVPVLWPFGSGTPQEDVERIAEKMEQGFETFMIKMGALPIATEIARVQAIAEAHGDAIRFNVDANQGWDLPQALEFMDGTAGFAIDFVEQPVPRSQQLWGFEALRARATHPLSADESVQTLSDAAALASRHLVDVLSLKISKNGGLSRTWKVATLAEAFGLKCLVNSMIELGVSQAAALHLAAALPNLLPGGHCFMSTLRLADDVTDFASRIERAVARVPDRAGLGIEIDPEKLERYTAHRMEIRG